MKTKEFFSINLKLIILLELISFDFSFFLKLIYDKKNNINELNQKISKIKEMSLENKFFSLNNDNIYDNIVIISVSNGLKQAKCFSSKHSSLNNAFDTAILKTSEYIEKNNIYPKYVKVDFSNYIKNLSTSSISDYIDIKNRNNFKYGIYFNINNDYILLEKEINSNSIIDYNKRYINLFKLNEYLNINIDKLPKNISLFTTIAYFCDENNTVYKISNNNDNFGFRDIENLNISLIEKIIDKSNDYLNNIILDNGKFIYSYQALTNSISLNYNFVRHAGSCWALAEVMKNNNHNIRLNLALNFMIQKIIYLNNNTGFINIDGKIILGTQGLFLTSLCSYLLKKNNDKLLKIAIQIGNGIIFMQNSDGQLRHILSSSNFSTLVTNDCFYFNGEAVLGLIKLYEVTKNKIYLNSAKKSMNYFIKNNYYIKEDHWIIYCSNEITKYVDDINYYQLGINSIKNSFDKIYFKKRTCPTDFEKLNQIFELFNRIKIKNINLTLPLNFEIDLLKTIKYRAKFQLNSCVFPEVGIYFKNPKKSIGAFYVKNKNYRIRNDDIQHSIVGYSYFLKNYKLIYST